MINRVAEILKENNHFLVMSHTNPDGDAIGSMLGMHLALLEMGKHSRALAEEPIPAQYDFLGVRGKVSTDPKAVHEPPDWIITVDCASEDRISPGTGPFRPPARLINIDHHVTNPFFGDLNVVSVDASCSAELVLRVLQAAGYRLSSAVAKSLYTGLITDTGCFRYPGVNSGTFRVASELLEAGFNSYEVSRYLYEEHPLCRFQLEALVLDRMEMMLHGSLVVSTLYADDFKRLNIDTSETENLVNRLREIRGVEAGVLITEMSNQITRVSLRSKGQLNVAEIAGTFGGGGHIRAAGFKTTLSPNQIKAKVVEALALAWATPDTIRVDQSGVCDEVS